MKKVFNNWILLVLLVSAIAFWQAVLTPAADKTCVWFLDVGQGDAIYIRTQDQHDILIDGGPDDKVLTELSQVIPYMDKEIDLVVATHPDKDHIGGLDEVLESYEVKEIWWNGEQKSSKTFKNFWEAVEE
jgi:beta-lactamase superfamily II metal-dependent hydrolase